MRIAPDESGDTIVTWFDEWTRELERGVDQRIVSLMLK
jgi:hypothetical protein